MQDATLHTVCATYTCSDQQYITSWCFPHFLNRLPSNLWFELVDLSFPLFCTDLKMTLFQLWFRVIKLEARQRNSSLKRSYRNLRLQLQSGNNQCDLLNRNHNLKIIQAQSQEPAYSQALSQTISPGQADRFSGGWGQRCLTLKQREMRRSQWEGHEEDFW